MTTTREPWQPVAIDRLVALGCDRERARRIAYSIETQKRISAEDTYLLYQALDISELCDEPA